MEQSKIIDTLETYQWADDGPQGDGSHCCRLAGRQAAGGRRRPNGEHGMNSACSVFVNMFNLVSMIQPIMIKDVCNDN